MMRNMDAAVISFSFSACVAEHVPITGYITHGPATLVVSQQYPLASQPCQELYLGTAPTSFTIRVMRLGLQMLGRAWLDDAAK